MGNVCSIARGGSPRPIEEYLTTDPNGINWIKIGDTEKDGKYILKTKEKILPTGLYKSRYVKSGDFLLTNSMSFGRPYILKTDGCIHDGWLVIGETDKVFYQDFLYYMLSSTFMYKSMSGLAAGSTVKNLKSESVKSLLIPIPSINEQKRISNKLEECIKLLDIINISKQEIIKIKDSIKERILCLAIQGKLVEQDPNDEPASILLEKIREKRETILGKKFVDSYIYKADDNCYYEKVGSNIKYINDEIPFEIPNSWEWVRLDFIGTWRAGSTPDRNNPSYYNGNIPWLKTGDLNDDYIIEIPEKITQYALDKTSVKINPAGSVLIAMYGATIGKLGILTYPATTNQACCACKPLDGIEQRFLFYFLLSQRNNFINRGVGGAQPNISKEKIITTLMPIPPQIEQLKIVNLVDTLLSCL